MRLPYRARNSCERCVRDIVHGKSKASVLGLLRQARQIYDYRHRRAHILAFFDTDGRPLDEPVEHA